MSATQIISIASARGFVEGLSLTDVRLIAAHEADASGFAVLAPYEPALLASLPHGHETIVTVLDLAETACNLEQYGMSRYVLARSRSLGLLTLARLLPTGIRLGPQIARIGIAGMGLMLVAAEMRHIADRGFGSAALHWQLSDLLVATGNAGWISRYIGLAHGSGLRAGLCSNDIGRALRLADELRGLDFIIAPLSAAGYRMTPDRPSCEAAIRRRKVEVLPHLGSLSTFDPADRAYAQGLGLTRFVVDP